MTVWVGGFRGVLGEKLPIQQFSGMMGNIDWQSYSWKEEVLRPKCYVQIFTVSTRTRCREFYSEYTRHGSCLQEANIAVGKIAINKKINKQKSKMSQVVTSWKTTLERNTLRQRPCDKGSRDRWSEAALPASPRLFTWLFPLVNSKHLSCLILIKLGLY